MPVPKRGVVIERVGIVAPAVAPADMGRGRRGCCLVSIPLDIYSAPFISATRWRPPIAIVARYRGYTRASRHGPDGWWYGAGDRVARRGSCSCLWPLFRDALGRNRYGAYSALGALPPCLEAHNFGEFWYVHGRRLSKVGRSKVGRINTQFIIAIHLIAGLRPLHGSAVGLVSAVKAWRPGTVARNIISGNAVGSACLSRMPSPRLII